MLLRGYIVKIYRFAMVVLFFPVSIFCSGADLPTIQIIATGGTIAGRGSSDISGEDYQSGVVQIGKLVQAVPEITKIASIKKEEQLFNISSSDLTIPNLLLIAKKVNAALKDKNVAGVVVTHGTDTMEETSYFLNLVVKSEKPVVIVGAMRPSTGLSADGPANLYNAVSVAILPEASKMGVMVVVNDRIFDGRNVVKTNNINIDSFSSPNAGPIGIAVDGMVKFYMRPLRKHTTDTPFDVEALNTLPKVGIVYDYAGSSTEMLSALIDADYKGIVFAGTGNGMINETSFDTIKKARDKGIVIVRASRTVAGYVEYDSLDELDSKYGLIPSGNLNPQKARILLMLALTKTSDIKEIQRYFNTY